MFLAIGVWVYEGREGERVCEGFTNAGVCVGVCLHACVHVYGVQAHHSPM